MKIHPTRIRQTKVRFRPQMWWFILLIALVHPIRANSAVPPPGYQVQNQSSAEYLVGSTLTTVFSNQVSTTVLPLYSIGLTPIGTVSSPAFVLQGAGGDTLYTTFVVENTGSARDSVTLQHALVGPSTIGLDQVILFRDGNTNGRFDPGEDDPVFLGLDPGENVNLDVAVVLLAGQGSGPSYVEIQATSFNDTLQTGSSVFLANTLGNTLHIGPVQNPRASPGGEGTTDDMTTRVISYSDYSVVFENDILNEGGSTEIVEVAFVDTVGWASPITINFEDTTGQILENSPPDARPVAIGQLAAGQQSTIRIRVESTGQPLYDLLADTLSVRIRARSIVDTLVVNETIDHIVLPPPLNPVGILSLDQTFRQNVASFGDVVTLVVSVTNLSDSVAIDSVVVNESVQPALNFLSSQTFSQVGQGLAWDVGTLQPNERRETAIKFVVNSRVSRGKTNVSGYASGVVISGEQTATGPVVNVIQIENDVFGDEGVVLGEVFLDSNANDKRDVGERGVPRVAVFLESGEYALSDSLGKFSIPRVFSGYRVVRLDESTLPALVEALPRAGAYATNTYEKLIHLLPSGHASVMFPLTEKDAPVRLTSRQITAQEIVSVHQKPRTVFQMPSIPSSNFKTGFAYLKTGKLDQLRPIADFLGKELGWEVVLEGHTDSIPIHTKEFPSNEELSVARAGAVKNFLVANGVPESRIVVRGFGARKPVATNSTPEGRAANRRVEVGFVPPGVELGSHDSVDRVSAKVEELVEMPDTIDVKIVWDISTDSPHTRDVNLELSMPDEFTEYDVIIRAGSREIQPVGNRYHIDGFVRSTAIACAISLRANATDSSLVDSIAARLSLASGLPLGHPDHAETVSDTLVLRPFRDGRRNTQTRIRTLASWDEPMRDNSINAPPANVGHLQARAVAEKQPPNNSDSDDDDSESFGLVLPVDGSVVSNRDEIEVVARFPIGSKFTIFSNGEAVSEKKIGQKVVNAKLKTMEVTYYGVKIESGWNTIALDATTVKGESIVDSISIALAGAPTAMEVRQDRTIVPADGQSTALVRIAIVDQLGLPAIDGLEATVSGSDSILLNADARPGKGGLQLVSRDGHFVLQVGPRTRTGRFALVLEAGELRTHVQVSYVPRQRPVFLSGILEARVGAFNISGDASPLGLDDYDDNFTLKGDSRFFVQGTGYAGINLTARIDSKKRYQDPLIKSFNPDRQYSVYGDASELHYAAPAEGGNYVALEKNESFLRYGDFQSPTTQGEFLKYRRTSVGVNGALVSRENSIKAFVTKTDLGTERDEIPGDGTSGYYYLSGSPVAENSETIVLETRDRFQPERILEIKPMVRHRDYSINYFDGAVLFKEPVPVTSNGFDPITIVAIYEVRSYDKGQYLTGVRGDIADAGRFKLGATAIANGGESSFDYALYGVDGRTQAGPFSVSGEYARSEDEIVGNGKAYKVEATVAGRRGEGSVYARRIDGDFVNPSFSGGASELSSQKAGFDGRLKMSPSLSVLANGFRHRLYRTNEEKDNVDAVARFENPAFFVDAGVRAARQERQDESASGLLSIAGVGAHVDGVEITSRWENNLGNEVVDEYPDRLKTRLAVPLASRFKILANHEYLSAHGRPATQQLLAGIEARAGRYTTAYTKYSMNSVADDRRLGAITGVRQQIPIRKGLSGTLDVENFRSFSSRLADEYVAVKSGLNWLRPKSALVESHYEYRWQRDTARHLIRLNAVRQLTSGVAILFKDALSFSFPDVGETMLRTEGRIAGVYRPDASPVSTLLMVRTQYDRFSPFDPDAITWRLVFSTDVNVIPSAPHEVRFKFASKRVEDYSLGISETTNNHLILSQYVYRFFEKWDVDVWGRFMTQGGVGAQQLGSGVEVGRIMFNRIRLSAGYSVNGFEERDLSENDAWSKGFGVRVQFILSDWLLNEAGFGN